MKELNAMEFEVLVCYNRECDLEDDYHAIIRVAAETREEAFGLVDNYSIDGMFDNLEDDYLEDSLHAVQVV